MTIDKIKKIIIRNPRIKGGRPIIAGTRVTVVEILDYIERDKVIDKITRELAREGVIVLKEEVLAALDFAKYKTEHETPPEKGA